MITVDRNIQHQQNIDKLPIAVLVLAAQGITYEHLKPMVAEVEIALKTIKTGELIKIESSKG